MLLHYELHNHYELQIPVHRMWPKLEKKHNSITVGKKIPTESMYQNHSIKQNLTLTYSVTANEDITKGGISVSASEGACCPSSCSSQEDRPIKGWNNSKLHLHWVPHCLHGQSLPLMPNLRGICRCPRTKPQAQMLFLWGLLDYLCSLCLPDSARGRARAPDVT